MLESVAQTPQELERYMQELKRWLAEAGRQPAEEMGEFFARRLDVYESVHLEHWPKEYAHIADFFEEGLSTLLDIGCGTGLELDAIYRRFPSALVTGVDLSAPMLEKLQAKYAGRPLRLLQGDYFEVPFEAEAYDAALSFETLHHFPYEKKRVIYEKLFRALKPGGCYIECDYVACCPEEEALCLAHYKAMRQKCRIPEGGFIHVDIPLTLDRQLELLERAGFCRVETPYRNGSTAILKAKKA